MIHSAMPRVLENIQSPTLRIKKSKETTKEADLDAIMIGEAEPAPPRRRQRGCSDPRRSPYKKLPPGQNGPGSRAAAYKKA
jgi:hypothetical protein